MQVNISGSTCRLFVTFLFELLKSELIYRRKSTLAVDGTCQFFQLIHKACWDTPLISRVSGFNVSKKICEVSHIPRIILQSNEKGDYFIHCSQAVIISVCFHRFNQVQNSPNMVHITQPKFCCFTMFSIPDFCFEIFKLYEDSFQVLII